MLTHNLVSVMAQVWPSNMHVPLQDEADRIVTAIQQFLQSGVPGSEIAVLYPKHLYGDPVEVKLLKEKIPFRRYGTTEILNRCVSLVWGMTPCPSNCTAMLAVLCQTLVYAYVADFWGYVADPLIFLVSHVVEPAPRAINSAPPSFRS